MNSFSSIFRDFIREFAGSLSFGTSNFVACVVGSISTRHSAPLSTSAKCKCGTNYQASEQTSGQESPHSHNDLHVPTRRSHPITNRRDTTLSTPQTWRGRRTPETANRAVTAQLVCHSRHQSRIQSHAEKLLLDIRNDRARSTREVEEHEIDVGNLFTDALSVAVETISKCVVVESRRR